MKTAAFFDVDGTLTSARVWIGLTEYFRVHRQKRATHYAYVGLHYSLYLLRKIGVLSQTSFRAQWAAHLAWYLRGYSFEEGEKIWDWVVEHHLSDHWRKDVRRILDHHRRTGNIVMLVSSGPAPLMRQAAIALGISHALGTRFEVREGCYTGRHLEPVCIGETKARQAREYLQREGIPVDFHASYAYADSISDMGMLEMVGNPVATYPDGGLRSIAQDRGWAIFPT